MSDGFQMSKAQQKLGRNSYRPLTERQREFVIAWLENGGNGTKAAMLAYGFSTPGAAAVCASRLLRNVNIKRAIKEQMIQSGLSVAGVIQKLMNSLESEPLAKRLKAVEMILKLTGS